MVKISQMQKMKEYFRIAGKISENPFIHTKEIASNLGLSRSTVSEYLESMYTQDMLVGPWMSLNPHTNYGEYVYLMNFSDESRVFEGLKRFPHVLYCGSTFGEWNTLVVTDRQLDFSQLRGFQSIVYQGVKGCTYTPEVKHLTWGESWRKVIRKVTQFTPEEPEYTNGVVPSLEWGEDQWKLFNAFRSKTRQKVTPVLRSIGVHYETYRKWRETLKDHCSVHIEFCPDGYKKYANYCLLLSSDYHQSVISLFSLFPATPVIMEMGDHLLVFVKVSSASTTHMVRMIQDMGARGMIKRATSAVLAYDYR